MKEKYFKRKLINGKKKIYKGQVFDLYYCAQRTFVENRDFK